MKKNTETRVNTPAPAALVDKFDAWWRACPAFKSRSDAIRHLMQLAVSGVVPSEVPKNGQ